MTSISRALSIIAESLPPSTITGRRSLTSSPNNSDSNCASRAFIQLMLPRSVLISPLCEMYRKGCASDQLGNVFVLKR